MASKVVKLIADQILKNKRALWEWQQQKCQGYFPPFYCSIDLRDSGYKIVPVDSNLYPAGFNNICPEDRRTAPDVFRNHAQNVARRIGLKSLDRILILPEAHTQNTYYLENLHYLEEIIRESGFKTKIGWYVPNAETQPTETLSLQSFTGKTVVADPIHIENGILSAGGFVPDLILLNNDFSAGYPKILDQVIQPIVPSHSLGWHSRKKSDHFKFYNKLAAEFAEIIGIDPWLIQIDTEEVAPVLFNDDIGIDAVAESVDRVLQRTQESFKAHQIKRKPFVFVKNNAGTYGMGIMVVHSGDEVRNLNRREKNKMSVGKNHLQIDSVVVQEGVPTATLVNRLASEPVIYLFGYDLIGGFLRSNTEKGEEDNLNSRGMVFKTLCMSDLRKAETEFAEDEIPTDEPILELVYGSIARLSALATGCELEKKLRSQKNIPIRAPLECNNFSL